MCTPKFYKLSILFLYITFLCLSNIEGQHLFNTSNISKKCLEAFDNPNLYSPQELYKLANEAIKNNQLDEARLYALRIYFDKIRTTNLLDLLALIEVKAGYNFLAHEWIQKSLALNPQGTFARKLLAQLPPRGKPANILPEKLGDHLQQIVSRLPILLQRLKTPKQFFDAILSELNRGHYYKALAITEEFEKRFPGVDGTALTALCAYYLGRGNELEKILQPALKQNPYHPILLFVKALVTDHILDTYTNSKLYALYFIDKWDEINELANQIKSLHKNSIESYLVLAQIAIDNQKFEEAQNYLTEAEKIDPSNLYIYKILSEAQFNAGYFTRAKNTIQKALPKAYCTPSIALKLALYEYSLGNVNDAMFLHTEIKNYFPFIEIQAYEPFILLSLHLDDINAAKLALNTWASKFPKNSTYYYLEAYYNLKINNNNKFLNSLIIALTKNQNKLHYIKLFSNLPPVRENTQIYQLLKDKLDGKAINLNSLSLIHKSLNTPQTLQEQSSSKSAQVSELSSTNQNQPTKNLQNFSFDINQYKFSKLPIQSSNFNFYASEYIDNSTLNKFINVLNQNAEEIIKKAEKFFGGSNNKIKIDIYIVPNLYQYLPMFYDPIDNKFIVSLLSFDIQNTRSYLYNNNPNNTYSAEELEALVQWLPQYFLTRELVKAIFARNNDKILKSIKEVTWLWHGIAEIYADNYLVSRYMLTLAQNYISSEKSKLVLFEDLNKSLLNTSNESTYITACAQSYIMTAYLVKKSANKSEGIIKCYDMLKDLAEQKDFNTLLSKYFGINKGQFDSGWKEATYWSLRQGLPFEWQ